MRVLAGLVMAALGATAAAAQTGRLTDASYIQAARCVGLASSSKLGSGDAAAMSAWFKTQAFGREAFVMDKADEMQREAKREADHASADRKPKLEAELSGACAALKS